MITTTNDGIRNLINAQRRPDGQIAEGVYMRMEIDSATNELCYLWLGTPGCGPMLQYSEAHGWTPCYSRGDYGRNYACGGHWSGHCRNLLTTRLIGARGAGDKTSEVLALTPDTIVPLPDGIKGDITRTDIDCSGSWTVFFPSASAALDDMLDEGELSAAALPSRSREHLINGGYTAAKKRLAEMIRAFGI